MAIDKRARDAKKIKNIFSPFLTHDEQEPGHEGLLRVGEQIWDDYVATLPANKKIGKPKSHAAAVHYAAAKLLGLKLTQRAISKNYHVSSGKISKTYRDIWHTLDLTTSDVRYTHPELAKELDVRGQIKDAHEVVEELLDDADDGKPISLSALESSLFANAPAILERIKSVYEPQSVSSIIKDARSDMMKIIDGRLFHSVARSLSKNLYTLLDANHVAREGSREDAIAGLEAIVCEALEGLHEHAGVVTRVQTTIDVLLAIWELRLIDLGATYALLDGALFDALHGEPERALFIEWRDTLALDGKEVRQILARANESARADLVGDLWRHHPLECVAGGTTKSLLDGAALLADASLEEEAIELLEEVVAHRIDRGQRSYYQEAAMALKMARDLHAHADSLGFKGYLRILLEETHRLGALHEELARAGLFEPHASASAWLEHVNLQQI